MSLVERGTDSGASVITLNDRENANRLSSALLAELAQAVRASLADREARVVVIRSAADVFCPGMDPAQVRSGGRAALEGSVRTYGDLLSLLHTSPKPVVCLTDGDVRAGGVGLVSACDIVLSSTRATFELGEVLFGLIPANVLPYLLRRLSPQKARYLVLTAKRLDASEARGLGLVDEVFEPADLERGARAVLKTLMRASPDALAEAKSFCRLLEGTDTERAREAAGEKLLEMLGRAEVREALEAFVQGDLPPWFGRYRPSGSLTAADGPRAAERGPDAEGKGPGQGDTRGARNDG